MVTSLFPPIHPSIQSPPPPLQVFHSWLDRSHRMSMSRVTFRPCYPILSRVGQSKKAQGGYYMRTGRKRKGESESGEPRDYSRYYKSKVAHLKL
ncbi:hypothetical protein C0J52_05159 [Blattella germanica]|nr:hypothetical protein C0J52_05159 [Blattella germanica]